MKRLITFLFILTLLLSNFVSAEVFENLQYTSIGVSNTYVITGYVSSGNNDTKTVTIPDSIEGRPVTRIRQYAFENCGITKVSFSEGLTTIENNALSKNNFKTVSFPNSLTTIGNLILKDCNDLTTIEFGKKTKLKSIANTAFDEIPNLKLIKNAQIITSLRSDFFKEFKNHTLLYSSDGTQILALKSEINSYKELGWYTTFAEARFSSPAKDPSTVLVSTEVTIYAIDGRTKVVDKAQLSEWLKVGWFEGVMVFAPDGRSKEVPSFNVALEESVGWKKGVTVYNKSGKSKIASPFNLAAEKNNGWYDNMGDVFTLLYAIDGRVKSVSNDKVEENVKVGWSKVPCDTTRFTAWTPGIVICSGYTFENTNFVYVKYGETTIANDSFNANTFTKLNRVEIPDTVISIEYNAFKSAGDTNTMQRMGIPKSVTQIDSNIFGYKKPTNLTIYCEKGSVAESFARNNGFKYVYATIIYSADGMKTMMVSDDEKTAYLKSGLWYTAPVIKLYDGYGGSKIVNRSELDSYLSNGWYEREWESKVRMYSEDGRTIDVYIKQVEDYKKVGWFSSYSEVTTKLFALDGRHITVNNNVVEAYKKVGWYTLSSYIDHIVSSKDYEEAIRELEYNLYKKNIITQAEYEQQFNRIIADFHKKTGAPMSIYDYWVAENSIGIPIVKISYRNLTNKTIVSYDLGFTCYDAYGNATSDSKYDSVSINAASDRIKIDPGILSVGTWTLYNNERTHSISKPYVKKVAFSDGTTWYR